MKKSIVLLLLVLGAVLSSFVYSYQEDLRQTYARPVSEWPKPTIDPGVNWSEFKSLPKIDSRDRKSHV